uniref:FMRFamide-related peptide FLP-32 n=1 Tax=Teladorsagia circumcincta TaxID=45464 RepID=Q0MVU1_TELCI|nr:FMRFamide-related peptide FLP-32 precursor [Teladorsagia circumcincta]
MIGRSFVLTLFISMLIVEAALPRMRHTKRAMRNSLVRFGKRADLSDVVLLEEPSGIADSDLFYSGVAQPRNQLRTLYN